MADDTIAPLDVLRGLFRVNGVSKTRRVSRERLKGIFDEAGLRELLIELAKEDACAEDKKAQEMEDRARDRFCAAVPRGDLTLTDFEFATVGHLEEDLSQRFYGPRDELESEFGTDFSANASADGTFNGEPFEVAVSIDMYHDMDPGTSTVFFDPHVRSVKAHFPLVLKDAVLTLCSPLPQLAGKELACEIESVAKRLAEKKQ